jgi:hypothetical protein
VADLREFAEGERWDELEALRAEYPDFRPFLFDVVTGLMGFDCTAVQLDIALYLERGPLFRMIQAQRGQAKTTITACYAVWRIIHDPTTRVLIISSGSDMATEISNWVIQIIKGMDELECLRPDRSDGDRASVRAFDIHSELKGPEKSPSVACIGITSNMQGKRADVLIADDVESTKNAATHTQRERVKHLTLDFTSICSAGDIIYLGTPQSVDSIYNGLPSRGYDIRIWPGRYPTSKELPNYGNSLAPIVLEALLADPTLQSGGGPMGDRGKPIDPVLLGEAVLNKKEVDQGPAYFQLQHMLDTRLMDAMRFPLKAEKLIFMNVAEKSAPLEINFLASPEHIVATPAGWPVADNYYRAAGFGQEFGTFQGTHMYVDPAGGGQNGDETAYAVTRFCAGRVFWVASGGVPGGLDAGPLDMLTEIAVRWKPQQIDIERNFGNGALSSVWTPRLLAKHKCGIEDVWETGQKELRIIDVLEPMLGSNRLVASIDLLAEDWAQCQKYPVQHRSSYSVFNQLSRITRDRGALFHDDRLDALGGSCRHWVDHLKQDEFKAKSRAQQDAYSKLMQNPLGNGRPLAGYASHVRTRTQPTALSRMKRKH